MNVTSLKSKVSVTETLSLLQEVKNTTGIQLNSSIFQDNFPLYEK